MKQYMEERVALETKYSDLCKPLYEEILDIVAGRLDDYIKRINKQLGGEKEEEWSKRDDDSDNNDAGEVEEREGNASLEDASNNKKIYGDIVSIGTNTTNAKDDSKDDEDEEGSMVGILQFWVCAMGHM